MILPTHCVCKCICVGERERERGNTPNGKTLQDHNVVLIKLKRDQVLSKLKI